MKSIPKSIGDPIKKYILWTLSDGRAYTANDLANYAGTDRQNVHEILKNVTKEKLAVTEKHRHQYFRLANKEVIEAVEALLLPELEGERRIYVTGKPLPEIKYCRSCHNHLAGKIGVLLAEQMQRKQFLIRQRKVKKYIFSLTQKGTAFFHSLAIETEAQQQENRIFAKACLDFSERKHHLGGALGAALLDKLLENGWLQRKADSRVLFLTKKGMEELQNKFEIDL